MYEITVDSNVLLNFIVY